MPSRRATRKRSNWYIYLLTFIITFMVLSFVVYNIWDYLFPARSQTAMSNFSDIRPDAEFNTTFLFMLGEKKGAAPEYYLLLNYRPRDDAILIVPLKQNMYAKVGNKTGTLSDMYDSGGADAVMLAIASSLGVECEHYVKFDKDSFIGFFDAAGHTPVNIPSDLRNGEVEFYAGSYELDGEMLYEYITYSDYGQGEDYRLMVHGHSFSNFINKNSRNLSTTQLQTLFNRLMNNTDSSLEFSYFTRNQQAYLYTTENSFNIADYYIPNGTTDEAGYFIIAGSTIATIHDRFGIIKDNE